MQEKLQKLEEGVLLSVEEYGELLRLLRLYERSLQAKKISE